VNSEQLTVNSGAETANSAEEANTGEAPAPTVHRSPVTVHAPESVHRSPLAVNRASRSDWRTAENVPADRSPLTVYRSPAAALGGIQRLRELHAKMDAAVLTAYGWTDLLPQCRCEFLLDYEDEEEEVNSGAEEANSKRLTVNSGEAAAPTVHRSPVAVHSPDTVHRSPVTVHRGVSRRKKPWRYRWPDEVRDEVLARLLKLNAERAEQEKLAGLAGKTMGHGDSATGRKKVAKPQKPRGKKTGGTPGQTDLFG
jgi:hypothetical protein